MKLACYFILLVFVIGKISAQKNRTEDSTGFFMNDSIHIRKEMPDAELAKYIEDEITVQSGIALGGYITSSFNEALDSVHLNVTLNEKQQQSILTKNGLFILGSASVGTLVDITILHPDYHSFDTSFIVENISPIILRFQLTPKYKILVRGRVYSGNLPLSGTKVNVRCRGEEFNLVTRACYYDEENYWNCLYNGMFKLSLVADNSEDSIKILLTKEGMRPLEFGMQFKDYTGEVLKLKMRYDNKLPLIPMNCISLKLSFPFLSSDNDWFVDISYYRLINSTNLRRFAVGLDANMFITNISTEIETLEGLEPSKYDSSYVSGTLGPSILFWFIPPENRIFGSYAGCTFAWNIGMPEMVLQPMIGTRYFLDQNKSLSLELRYAELQDDIVQHSFNYYGNAYQSNSTQTFSKLHLNLGVQVVF